MNVRPLTPAQEGGEREKEEEEVRGGYDDGVGEKKREETYMEGDG